VETSPFRLLETLNQEQREEEDGEDNLTNALKVDGDRRSSIVKTRFSEA